MPKRFGRFRTKYNPPNPSPAVHAAFFESAAALDITEKLSSNHVTSRVQLGLKLWLSGAARNAKEAGRMAGCSQKALIWQVKKNGTQGTSSQMIGETMGQVIERLAKKALDRSDSLLDSEDENVVARVASDILDRNPETAKSSKMDVSGRFAVGTLDAQAIAAALVASNGQRERYAEAAQGDFVRVPSESLQDQSESSLSLALVTNPGSSVGVPLGTRIEGNSSHLDSPNLAKRPTGTEEGGGMEGRGTMPSARSLESDSPNPSKTSHYTATQVMEDREEAMRRINAKLVLVPSFKVLDE